MIKNSALTYEHAWGDGVPNLRYLETIGAEIKNKSRVGPEMEYRPGNLDEIKFDLDEKSIEDIKKAHQFNELQKKDLLVDSLPAGNVSNGVVVVDILIADNRLFRHQSLNHQIFSLLSSLKKIELLVLVVNGLKIIVLGQMVLYNCHIRLHFVL